MTQTQIQPTGVGSYFIGIDAGTGSARAGVFDAQGQMLGSDKCPITLFRESGHHVEQSSEEIWQAVAASVRGAMAATGIAADEVGGIGFDATCSLVVLGEGGAPLPVGEADQPHRNIIVWMDHRALDQAERINSTGHKVLDYVGGRISPEMETPKLLWLKEHRPEIFAAAWQFMDLTDFLTWRATGDLARSICTVTCKWTYLGHEARWDPSYFEAVGLGEIADEGFTRIGTTVVDPGTALGKGLTEEAAATLGLRPGTPVAAGLINAHAGGIGSVRIGEGPTANLAYVFGTSSCTMTTTAEPVFVPGVWGPYYSAMVPGMWLNEGGQSVAGAAIEQLLDFHPYAPKARVLAEVEGRGLPDWLAERATARLDTLSDIGPLVGKLQVVPEFLGNRAPFADPNTRAVIAGLGMERDEDSLIALYLAGICGIGYGLRQIVEAQAAAGAHVNRIVISGGAGRNPLIRQILADATGLDLEAPVAKEPVLLGSAILGAVAGGTYPTTEVAMACMTSVSDTYRPQRAMQLFHSHRFEIYKQLQALARRVAEKA